MIVAIVGVIGASLILLGSTIGGVAAFQGQWPALFLCVGTIGIGIAAFGASLTEAPGPGHPVYSEKASARAEALLMAKLTPEQRREFEATGGWFHVRGSDGLLYWINTAGKCWNIDSPSEGLTFCGGPFGLPVGDFILAQKLALESDALWFRRIAHRETRLKRHPFAYG